MNPPSPNLSPRPESVADVAARWLARRDAGLTRTEQVEFQRWWAADPRHAAAWQDVESAWRAFDLPREAGISAEMIQALDRRRRRRRWRLGAGVAASLTAAAAAIVVMVMRPDSSRGDMSRAEQRGRENGPIVESVRPDPSRGIISRIEQRVLEDGTVVELGRGAQIEVRYEPSRRFVKLLRGEALFTVAKNPVRPFIVSTGRVDVQAVGTAFAVHANAEAVDVIVTEGRVAVGRSDPNVAAPSAPPVLVAAGDRLLVPVARTQDEQLQPVALTPEELGRRLAWRGPRVELAATRLADAVALFNRENRTQLRVADSTLAELRLSGVFRADDAEGFARLLEANYEVRVTRNAGSLELRNR